MKNIILLTFFHLLSLGCFSQIVNDSCGYEKTYTSLSEILLNPKQLSFKNAVFITENTFLNHKLDSSIFENYITDLTLLTNEWIVNNHLSNYRNADSQTVLKNFGIYKILKDSIKVFTDNKSGFIHLPYTYDFEDFFAQKDWKNMFVTKLIATHSGNCHSLPYLYKILADELGATCWLSLAPNHMYIKNRCKKIGWYNTELTSGEFPIDAWITTSGYIPVKAVQTGIYMDTLSNQQAIALCVLDLAKGYEFQTKNYYDGFIIKCCDLVLQYHPVNVQAMLLKAETLKRIYEEQKADKNGEAIATYKQMEELYIKMFDLGYREMPEKMYMQWLRSVTQQRDKYGNKAVKATLNKH